MFLRKQKLLKDSIVLYLKKQTRWTRTRAAIKTKETLFLCFSYPERSFLMYFNVILLLTKKQMGRALQSLFGTF